jgi:peptide subunit release factor 1 (eRF1)
MKKTVKMTCILKSGVKVEDSIKFDSKDTRVLKAIESMRKDVENYMSSPTADKGQLTFGTTTIAVSEIAAITFK